MKSIHYSCVGEGHKSNSKPCQDYSFAESSETLSMAIVSDGHGGDRYFRSRTGARLAVEITAEAVRKFVKDIEDSTLVGEDGTSVFKDTEFTRFGPDGNDNIIKDKKAHERLLWLFSSIISKWNKAVAKDARKTPVSDWEKANVDPQLIDEFKVKAENGDGLEKTYGCTLVAYVQTPTYWVAFHIGDGKCVMLRKTETGFVCEQPIPWDERCFLNKTTSLCDSEAVNRFRYCFQGGGEFPPAVFLGSDGLDDSYGDGEYLANFYLELLKIAIVKGNDAARLSLKRCLPIISKRGSKDDMSVACLYDDGAPLESFSAITDYQVGMNSKIMEELKGKVRQLERKIEDLENSRPADESVEINLKYARQDVDAIKARLKHLGYRNRYLKGALSKYKKTHCEDMNPCPVSNQ